MPKYWTIYKKGFFFNDANVINSYVTRSCKEKSVLPEFFFIEISY